MPEARAGLRATVTGTLSVLVVTALVLAGVFLARGRPDDAGTPAATEAPGTAAIGSPAPEFKALDVAEQPVILSEASGKGVWLVFQATWCTTCRTELPDVDKAARTGSARVIGVYLRESKATVADYAERLKVGFPSVPDPTGEIARKYQVTSVPTHVFIDPGGSVKAVRKGALSPEQIAENLAAIGG